MTEFAEHEEQESVIPGNRTAGEGKVLPWARPKAAAPPVVVPLPIVNVKRDNVSTLKPKETPALTTSQRNVLLISGSGLIAAAAVFGWFMVAERAWQLALFVVTFLFIGLRMFLGGWARTAKLPD